jgi:hypothetical protein
MRRTQNQKSIGYQDIKGKNPVKNNINGTIPQIKKIIKGTIPQVKKISGSKVIKGTNPQSKKY